MGHKVDGGKVITYADGVLVAECDRCKDRVEIVDVLAWGASMKAKLTLLVMSASSHPGPAEILAVNDALAAVRQDMADLNDAEHQLEMVRKVLLERMT